MNALIEQVAKDMVDHLTESNLAEIAEYYEFPAAVYFDANVIVLQSPDDLLHAVGIYRSVLQSRQLAHIHTRVVDAPTIDRDRFTVTVSNRYFDHRGCEFGTSRIRYFVQCEGECPKLRLVEYLDWPCGPELKANAAFQKLCKSTPPSRSIRDRNRHAGVQLH